MSGARKLGLVFVVLAAASALLEAQGRIQGTEAVFKTGIVDLREGTQIRHSGGKGPDRPYTARDLEVGSIFITTANEARKVTAIYQDGDRTVIETTKPRIEEVLETFTIPDQTVTFTRENIVPTSVADGVTITTTQAASGRLASTLPGGSEWLDTDPRWLGSTEIHTLNIDIPLWSSSPSGNAFTQQLLEKLEGESGGDEEKKKENQESADKIAEASGGVDGEVRIQGTLRLAGPVLKAGAQMPEIKISWVRVWWYFGYPKIELKPGYVHASLDAAEQLDCKLSGKISLQAEIRVPLVGYAAQGGGCSFAIGLYLKVTLDGSITFGFEISEYADMNLWGTVDLMWPFIPTGISVGSDRAYVNAAVRPYIAAEIESKAGAFIGAEATILGMNIFSAEAGGGLYAEASGLLESKSAVGFSSTTGGYGSFDSWRYSIDFEMGAFLAVGLSFLFWDLDILDYRWPFLQIHKEGEF